MERKESAPSKAVLKYKIHWHVLFTHFPVSFFMISFGFMVLHLVTRDHCYEIAASLSLFAGLVILVPTAISGWLTWKGSYKGMKGKIFIYKIRVAVFMIICSLILVLARILLPDELHMVWMWIYPTGITLLMLGSMVEGFYGGRLNHR